jgi:hypothetical protein
LSDLEENTKTILEDEKETEQKLSKILEIVKKKQSEEQEGRAYDTGPKMMC